jgi:hypothetical protein
MSVNGGIQANEQPIDAMGREAQEKGSILEDFVWAPRAVRQRDGHFFPDERTMVFNEI